MSAQKPLFWWPSPAKLNLFLHITGRRADGYHELQSLFQLLSHGDELAFEINQSGKIRLATEFADVPEQDNLIVRAARKLKAATECQFGCTIHVRKRLPMGGGIGGGSSNAATTLRVLNAMWGCDLDLTQLAELGKQLGADVPVFIYGKTAFAEGIGEKLTPIALPSQYYLVANPNCAISTATIFNQAQLPRNSEAITANQYQFDTTRNDCQALVMEYYPAVAKLIDWLLQFAPTRMTGTGACVFAVFDEQSKAERVKSLLPVEWAGFVAQGLDESPLNTALLDFQLPRSL